MSKEKKEEERAWKARKEKSKTTWKSESFC